MTLLSPDPFSSSRTGTTDSWMLNKPLLIGRMSFWRPLIFKSSKSWRNWTPYLDEDNNTSPILQEVPHIRKQVHDPTPLKIGHILMSFRQIKHQTSSENDMIGDIVHVPREVLQQAVATYDQVRVSVTNALSHCVPRILCKNSEITELFLIYQEYRTSCCLNFTSFYESQKLFVTSSPPPPWCHWTAKSFHVLNLFKFKTVLSAASQLPLTCP